jgi:hypothetical protein
MFEISIICVILLAISYWVVLFLMGRREDVLHGEFVKKADAPADEPARSVFPDRPVFPEPPAQIVFPKRPVIADKPVIAAKPLMSEKPGITEIPVQAMVAQKPARAAAPEQPAFRPERLESLLNSIKQDLNQLVQK